MGLFRRRANNEIIPGNGHSETITVFGPDLLARERADSMAMATNTASPMARGVKKSGAMGFTGDRGYGVNRWAGGMWVNNLPVSPQGLYSEAQTTQNPLSLRLGYGSGVAGQPGLPQTGANGAGGADQAAWLMSMAQMTPGMGG